MRDCIYDLLDVLYEVGYHEEKDIIFFVLLDSLQVQMRFDKFIKDDYYVIETYRL